MITVKIVGGLGNQMFGYAFAKALKNKGKEVVLDLSFYKNQTSEKITKRKFELKRVFNISFDEITKEQKEENRKLGELKQLPIYIDKEDGFDSTALEFENGLMEGYWQSFKYIEDIEDEIRHDFTFPEIKDKKSVEILKMIRNTNSVSVQIRRDDYVRLGIELPLSYYVEAIEYIKDRVENPVFFITSDDIEWCKKMFGNNMNYIDWTYGDNHYFDMQMISECKHNILSNSTFGFWGAWLNDNPEKIVIRPKVWFSTKGKVIRKDFWKDQWITLGEC